MPENQVKSYPTMRGSGTIPRRRPGDRFGRSGPYRKHRGVRRNMRTGQDRRPIKELVTEWREHSCGEIEEFLLLINPPSDAPTCGRSDPNMAKSLRVREAQDNESAGGEEIRSSGRSNLAFPDPSIVLFLNDFPLTASGKVQNWRWPIICTGFWAWISDP